MLENANELRIMLCREKRSGTRTGTSVIAACGELHTHQNHSLLALLFPLDTALDITPLHREAEAQPPDCMQAKSSHRSFRSECMMSLDKKILRHKLCIDAFVMLTSCRQAHTNSCNPIQKDRDHVAGIFVNDIMDAVPIDKYFELFKPGQGGEGGFIRIGMDYVKSLKDRDGNKSAAGMVHLFCIITQKPTLLRKHAQERLRISCR